MNYKRLLASALLFSIIMSLCACSFIFGVKCPSCGEKCDSDMLYCPYCRAELTGSKKCSKGHENVDGAKYCAECGETLNNTANNDNSDVSSLSSAPTDPNASVWLLLESVENTEYKGGIINTRQYNYTSIGTCKSAEETGTWRSTKEDYYTADITFNYQNFEDGVAVSCTYNRAYLPQWESYPENDTHWDVYDKNGNFLYRTKNSDEWFTPYESTETRDTDGGGKEVTKTKTLPNGVEVTDISLYDEGGALIKFTHNCPSYKNASNLKAEIVEYENGKMVRYYQHPNVVGYDEPYLRAECEYDNHGNCVKTTVYTESNAVWAITQYTYITLKDYLEQHNNKHADAQNNGSNGSSNGSLGGTTTKGYPCEWCKQSGKLDCRVCKGTGKVSDFDSKGNKIMKTCPYKDCFYGKEECYHCGGDGIYLND